MHSIPLVMMSALSSYSKVVTKTLTFKPNKLWQYVSKFGVSIGSGKYIAKARFKKPFDSELGKLYNLKLTAYLDTAWESAVEESICEDKISKSIRKNEISLNSNGEWSYTVDGIINQKTRPYVWFFAVSTCDGSLVSDSKYIPPIEIYLKFNGNDNTEFTHEENYMTTLYFIVLLFYTIFLGYSVYNYYTDTKKTEKVDSPILILLIAVILEFISILAIWICERHCVP